MAYKSEFPGCEQWSVGPNRRMVYAPTGAAGRDALRKQGEPMAVYFKHGTKVAEQWCVND